MLAKRISPVSCNGSLAQTITRSQLVILIRVIMPTFTNGSILYTSIIMKANSQRRQAVVYRLDGPLINGWKCCRKRSQTVNVNISQVKRCYKSLLANYYKLDY